jgi:Ala-tRNA(Pro) deacylase
MIDIYAFLSQHGIKYERFDHPAVFTCEESERLPPMPGADTKNLFLRDETGEKFFLVTVGHAKSVDLKALKPLLGAKKLSFGSPEKLKEYLGVEPGSVTLLGLMHDTDHKVSVIVDEDVWKQGSIQCHPLVNTATLVILKEGMERFFKETGHEYRVLNVPDRSQNSP